MSKDQLHVCRLLIWFPLSTVAVWYNKYHFLKKCLQFTLWNKINRIQGQISSNITQKLPHRFQCLNLINLWPLDSSWILFCRGHLNIKTFTIESLIVKIRNRSVISPIIHLIGHQHAELVIKTFCLQYPSLRSTHPIRYIWKCFTCESWTL